MRDPPPLVLFPKLLEGPEDVSRIWCFTSLCKIIHTLGNGGIWAKQTGQGKLGVLSSCLIQLSQNAGFCKMASC